MRLSVSQPCFCRQLGLDKTNVDTPPPPNTMIEFGAMGTIMTWMGDNDPVTTGVAVQAWRKPPQHRFL
jgi:hypothetical protein